MVHKLFALSLSPLLLFLLSCSSLDRPEAVKDTLLAQDLRTVGRFDVVDQKLELVSSGAHFGLSFEGGECILKVSLDSGQNHNYLQYELDGVYQKRLKIAGGKVYSLQITAPSSGKHELRIFKATEAHTGPIFVHQIQANNIKPLAVPDEPVIEFIGNSITCGAASDPSEVPCGTAEYHDQHNAYMAYGPRVARMLKVNFLLSSVSGIGVYRNWNSDGPVMPEVYEKLDFQKTGSRMWNFNTFPPKVVSIALGTNDFSNGDGKRVRLPFDPLAFTSAYVNFVKAVKSKNPSAQIVLLSSPMVSGDNNEVFKACLENVKHQIDKAYPGDRPVGLFFFQPLQPRGCSFHPSVEDHQIMAKQLRSFFAKHVQ